NLNTDTLFSRTSGVYTNTGAFNISTGQTFTISGAGQGFNQKGGTFNKAGSFAFSIPTFNFNRGFFPGSPVPPTHPALTIGAGATTPVSFLMRGSSTFAGNLVTGQTLWVQGGGSSGHANLTAASGFRNGGTIRLESLSGGYSSNLAVSTGTLTNTSTG